MTDSKIKKHVKVKHAVGGGRGSSEATADKVAIGESSSEIESTKQQNKNHEFEKDRSVMLKIEALCKQFGVPDPEELYVIPRDFSGKPNITQYDIKMPEGLARWVDEAEFEYTIGKINFYFANAEKIDCRTVWNGVCKFLTCFMIRACQRTRIERAIIRVRNFILQQNQDVYHAKGFHIVEPAARGLRHLEFRSITYYSMKYFLDHEDEIHVTESEAHVTHHEAPHRVMARHSVMSHF